MDTVRMLIFPAAMNELGSRLRFRFNASLTPAQVKARLEKAVQENNFQHRFVLTGSGPHFSLAYPQVMRTAWTPQMDIDLEVVEGETWVRCLIGPSPSIWMLFMGGYMLCMVLALLGLSIGVAQQVVGAEPWGFMLVIPTPVVALVLWSLAQGGKRRARVHVQQLRGFFDMAMGAWVGMLNVKCEM